MSQHNPPHIAPVPELLPLGADGIVVRFGRRVGAPVSAAVLAFQARLVELALPELVEIAPSLTSVLVRFDPAVSRRATIETRLREVLQSEIADPALPAPKRIWHVPVSFGGAFGPDLTQVADVMGVTPQNAVQQVLDAPLRVLALGFAPGQPYLGYLSDGWDIPRKSELTPQVSAGALVAALRQLVLFNNASATGWHQIGETAFRPFRQGRGEPFLLCAGDAVRFHAVGVSEYADLKAADDGLGGARCEVLT